MRLNVGAGERLLEGFTNHDARQLPGIDLVCDIFELPSKVEVGSVEEISAFHIIEHFNRKQCVEVLKMFHSLLKPGGILNLEIPNMRYHAQLIVNGDEEQAELYCFGGQDYPGDQHLSGWTPNIAIKRLQEAGFINGQVAEAGSMVIRMVK